MHGLEWYYLLLKGVWLYSKANLLFYWRLYSIYLLNRPSKRRSWRSDRSVVIGCDSIARNKSWVNCIELNRNWLRRSDYIKIIWWGSVIGVTALTFYTFDRGQTRQEFRLIRNRRDIRVLDFNFFYFSIFARRTKLIEDQMI